jgi:hypothetical protein
MAAVNLIIWHCFCFPNTSIRPFARFPFNGRCKLNYLASIRDGRDGIEESRVAGDEMKVWSLAYTM